MSDSPHNPPPRPDDGDPVKRLSRRIPHWTAKVPTWVIASLLVALADWLDRTELTWVVPALRSVQTDRLIASGVLGAALAAPGALQRWRPKQTLAMALVGACAWPAMLLGLHYLPVPWLWELPLAAAGLTTAVTLLEIFWRGRRRRGAVATAVAAGIATGACLASVLWLTWTLLVPQVPPDVSAWLRAVLALGLPALGWSVIETALAWRTAATQRRPRHVREPSNEADGHDP
ncbi:MAG: hypothetical protein ACLFV7_08170 [Phycisphaerae bacterium]